MCGIQVFNAWVDEKEPKSPLGELFAAVVPVMQKLRRRRGAILFPPKPPHETLPPPPKLCVLPPGYLPAAALQVEINRRWTERSRRDVSRQEDR